MNKYNENRPALVQGSEAPIVIREGETLPPLICENCRESVLVENYLEDCFVGIGLQCFKCKNVTWTPSLPEGEIFPQKTLTLGREGRFLIGASVVNSKDVVMTCDQELDLAKSHTTPKSSTTNNLELSVDNIELLITELDVLSGGRFNKYIHSATRSVTHGSVYFRENPLAWSLVLLKNQLVANELTINNPTLVALGFLQSYRDVLARWRDHIHFPILAQEFCAYFYHTLIQLVVASYLTDHGNRIAINVAGEKEGVRNADLYVRLSGSEKLFVEIKGPEAFEWIASDITLGKMKKVVEKCLSNSRGQIDINNPGILVIGSTCLENDFLAALEKVLRSVLHAKGRSYKAIAGIATVGLKEVSLEANKNNGSKVSTAFNVGMVTNKYFYTDNPVRTST